MRAVARPNSPNFSQRLAAGVSSPETEKNPERLVATDACRTVASPSRRRAPAELEQLATELEEQVAHMTHTEESRLRMFGDHAQRISEALLALRVAREIQDERHQKEMRMLESNVHLGLDGARQARLKEEARREEAADTRLNELRDALRRERSAHDSAQQDYAKELGEEVRRLSTAADEHREARSEYGERIASSLEAEFEKLQDAILSQQQVRFEAESAMVRMVEDVGARMRAEVRAERDEREAVQSKLLGLLEDTCSRIEATYPQGRAPRPSPDQRGCIRTLLADSRY